MKNLYIIGASGSGREVLEMVKDINESKPEFEVVGFVDDDKSLWGTTVNGIKVVGGIDYLKEQKDKNSFAVITIADCDIKERIAEELDGSVKWCNIIHPAAKICSFVEIGTGNIIQQNVFIGPNAKIGDHVLLNTKIGVAHDAIIGDHSSLMNMCDITGHVHLEKKVYAGSRVTVTPGCTIGESAKLGAGAVIMKDVKPGVTMHGYRAVEAKKTSNGGEL